MKDVGYLKIYIGARNGLQAISINNGIPVSTEAPIGKNVVSSLKDLTIIGIYPAPLGSGNIYAVTAKYMSTTAQSNINKLWGYYPQRADRSKDDTWNCE